MRGIDKAHIALAALYLISFGIYLAGFFSMHSEDLFYNESQGDFVRWLFLELSTGTTPKPMRNTFSKAIYFCLVVCPTIGLLTHIAILISRKLEKWKAVAIVRTSLTLLALPHIHPFFSQNSLQVYVL